MSYGKVYICGGGMVCGFLLRVDRVWGNYTIREPRRLAVMHSAPYRDEWLPITLLSGISARALNLPQPFIR